MKVYVVTNGSYSAYHIEAVFTDKETAELYCITNKHDFYGEPEVEEWEADNIKLEGKVYRAVTFSGQTGINRDGNFYLCKKVDYVNVIRDCKPIEEDFESKFDGQYHYYFTIPVDKYVTYEQACKIAQDKWDKYIAEKEYL